MEFIRSLTGVNRHDVALAGGKAANLGELMQMGLPVPPGFVLLTSAYTTFVEENALSEEIERLVQQASLQAPQQLEESSCAIRSLFDRSAIPVGRRGAFGSGETELGKPMDCTRPGISHTLGDLIPDHQLSGHCAADGASRCRRYPLYGQPGDGGKG